MGRVLAIDYGQKRVGLAVTDPDRIIAGPLTTVASRDVISFLRRYTETETVDVFVVGEPRQMNNTPSESVKFIDPFIRLLRKEFPAIPVERADERFSSMIAQQTILASGMKKKDRREKGTVDMVSAVIILQTYLEMKSFEYKRAADGIANPGHGDIEKNEKL
ncbi:MAG TPA: Holliday junction resolvase RuvX [Lentimicrobium sp.]|nr:Holliday junction resolvase RuvX [Lentimicrobium sp.]